MLQHELGRVVDHHAQEATGGFLVNVRLLDFSLGVRGLRTAGLFALDGVFVVQSADREFLHTERVDAVILPMAVAAEGEDIVQSVIPQPLKKAVCLVFEAGEVRVVVRLAIAIRADHGRGSDDDLPCGVTCFQRRLQPLALLTAPNRLFRTVGHFIGRAIISAFDKPELQMPVNAMRAIGGRGAIFFIEDGHLLAEYLDACGRRWKLFATEIGVVEAEVVIVFRPKSRDVGKELDHARKAKLLVPFLPQLGQRLSRRLRRMIVINDVTRADEEIGLQGGHGSDNRIAKLLVLIRGGDGTTAVGLAMHEGVVVHATAHAKAHGAAFTQRLEAACGAGLGGLTSFAENKAVMVQRARFEPAGAAADDEVVIRLRLGPLAACRLGKVRRLTPLKIRDTFFPRHIAACIEHRPGNGRESALKPDGSRGYLACHLALGVLDFSEGGERHQKEEE